MTKIPRWTRSSWDRSMIAIESDKDLQKLLKSIKTRKIKKKKK